MEPKLKFRVWVDRVATGTVDIEAESREAAAAYVEGNMSSLRADIVWGEYEDNEVVDVEEVE